MYGKIIPTYSRRVLCMSDTVLEARHMKKIYNHNTPNAFEALHDINFRVEKGDFVAVMGPS